MLGPVYGRSPEECIRKMGVLRKQAEIDGGVRARDTTTLADYLEQWLARGKVTWQPRTFDLWEHFARAAIIPSRLARSPLSKLTPVAITAWTASLEREQLFANPERGLRATGARSRQIAHQVLTQALADAVRAGAIATNPATLTARPRHTTPEIDLWDIDEALRFLTAARDMSALAPEKTAIRKSHREKPCAEVCHYLGFFEVLFRVGPRPNELLGARRSDFDLRAGTLKLQQQLDSGEGRSQERKAMKTTSSRRTIALPADALAALKSHLARMMALGLSGSPWLFPTPTGVAPHLRNVTTRHYDEIIARTAIGEHGPILPLRRVTLYSARHTAATIALKGGVSDFLVAQMLGNSVDMIRTTYGHLVPSMVAEQVARLDAAWSRNCDYEETTSEKPRTTGKKKTP